MKKARTTIKKRKNSPKARCVGWVYKKGRGFERDHDGDIVVYKKKGPVPVGEDCIQVEVREL